jgi:p-cumate 2,3-dioxygenase subunit beta
MKSLSLKEQVENFLYDESRLLDKWKLKEWEALFTDDGEYLVPPLNIDDADKVNPKDTLFFIADNRAMISARTTRLLRKDAYVESPRSRIRHLVTNVSILAEDENTLRISANLIVYRARRGQISTYVAEAFYTLVRENDSFKIRGKRVCLDNDILKPQGSLAIIL